tara:strand:+ start:129 stop:449 length:321 start_codon:yes stop_codon:yes gene_type:complete
MEYLIPGEIIIDDGFIELNSSKKSIKLKVSNLGDRPIQVGSHYHFFETNISLEFKRERALGMRLDIPAGTAIRFEPGDTTEVKLIPYGGTRNVYGFNNLINGPLKN